MQEMKGKETQEGVYAKTEDNTLQDLMWFQDFLYRNLSNQEKYDDMGYQDFAQLIREQPPLVENEEYVSYYVESLFTNIPNHDTIKYCLEEIYTNNKLPNICSKLIFKRLLLKRALMAAQWEVLCRQLSPTFNSLNWKKIK